MAAEKRNRLTMTLVCCLSLLALLTLTFAACGEKPEQSTAAPEKITIAYPTSALSMLYQIASEKGFFKAQNLDVTAQPHEFGKPALQSLLEGKADLAIVADTPVMMAIAGGRNINIIAVIFTSNRGNAVVALKDRGISAPADLERRTIGVPLGTTADFFLDSLLTTHGVKRSQVVIADIKPGEMLDALQQGKVDAVSAWNPTLMQLRRRLGDRGVFFFDEAIYSDVACVVAEGSFVKSRPQSIEKLLQAFIEAEAFVKANPDESKRLITGFLNTEKELLDEIWNATDLRVSLDQSLIVDLEDQTRWAQENGLIGHQDMPNYLDYIYVDGLQSVKPEAVGIIR